jgi:beta-glucanase (GH16 family)
MVYNNDMKEQKQFKLSILFFFFISTVIILVTFSNCEHLPAEREPFTAPPPSSNTDNWTPPPGYQLVWSDEFDDPEINLNNWSYETEETGWSPTWNSEWQRYTDNGTGDRNASINNGVLVIKGIDTDGGNGGYTSARMVTKNKQSWQYGIIAARMQLPEGQGMWPALWMMGINRGWPACGEIDILEMIGGGAKDQIARAALHWDNGGHQTIGNTRTMPEKLSADWHYYECVWTATSITIKIDGNEYFTKDISDGQFEEFRQPFYLLLNLAIGGEWPGPPSSSTEFPAYMYIDWVRVYQPE